MAGGADAVYARPVSCDRTFGRFPHPHPLSIQADTTYYLTGNPADQANKVVDAAPSTPTFNTTAPTGAVPITQTATPLANADFAANPLAAFWSGPYSGPATGVLDLRWYWSTVNPATIALGSDVEVTVFADPDYAADPEQPTRIIGRATVPLTGISATPTLVQSLIPINGNVQGTLLIQVVSAFVDTGNGILIHYGSTTTPSSFTIHAAPPRIPFPAATQASGYSPRYKAYAPSNEQLAAGLGIDAGEPSIGANWFTDKVMFQAMLQTLRVSFDDSCATTPGSRSKTNRRRSPRRSASIRFSTPTATPAARCVAADARPDHRQRLCIHRR